MGRGKSGRQEPRNMIKLILEAESYFSRKFAPPKITHYTVSIDLKRSYLNEISFEVCYLHTLYGLEIKDAKLENRLIPDGRGFYHTHNYKDKYVHAYMHCACLVVME